MHKHDNGTPSFSDVFRTYIRFASEKYRSDIHLAHEYSAGAMDVVMEFIEDNIIDEPAMQRLAAALGEWETCEGEEETDDGA